MYYGLACHQSFFRAFHWWAECPVQFLLGTQIFFFVPHLWHDDNILCWIVLQFPNTKGHSISKKDPSFSLNKCLQTLIIYVYIYLILKIYFASTHVLEIGPLLVGIQNPSHDQNSTSQGEQEFRILSLSYKSLHHSFSWSLWRLANGMK